MSYSIQIYISSSIDAKDNYSIGGTASYFMRAEKDGKTALEKAFEYKDESVKRNELYIYAMYDALGHVRGNGHTIDFNMDNKYVVITAEKTRSYGFCNSNGAEIAHADAWKKFYKRLKEKCKTWRISYMTAEDIEVECHDE